MPKNNGTKKPVSSAPPVKAAHPTRSGLGNPNFKDLPNGGLGNHAGEQIFESRESIRSRNIRNYPKPAPSTTVPSVPGGRG